MNTTEENPLNLSEPTQIKNKQADVDKTTSNLFSFQTSTASTYIIIGVGIIALIIVAVYYLYHKSQTDSQIKMNEISIKNDELLKTNKSLQQELQQLQIDNENYVQHIDRLAAQLEQQQRQTQEPPYSPLTPMTENSFDAPDPNAVPQKPQIIKDKDEIKKMVNAKRPTVQDEVDRRKQQQDTNEDDIEKQTKEEIKQITNVDDEDLEEHAQEVEDGNVQALMNIIQSQTDN